MRRKFHPDKPNTQDQSPGLRARLGNLDRAQANRETGEIAMRYRDSSCHPTEWTNAKLMREARRFANYEKFVIILS